MAIERSEQLQEITELLEDGAETLPDKETDLDETSEEDETPDESSESTEDETGEKPEGDETEIKSLNDLAAAIGIEPSALYDLEMKLSNEDAPIRLGDLKDQLQHFKQEEKTLHELKSDLDNQRQLLQQQSLQVSKQTEALNKDETDALLELQAVQRDFARIDWTEFENLDPGRCALEQQKLVNRQLAANQKFQNAQQAKHEASMKAFQDYAQQQSELLLRNVPEWRDSDRFNKDVQGIAAWAKETYGLSEQELGLMFDWRQRQMVFKAYQWDLANKNKTKLLKNAIKPLGKSGKALTKDSLAKNKVSDLIKTARRTRNQSDQVRAINALLYSK